MESLSILQQQFPLSPRKFWKKILIKIIGIIFFDVLFGGVIGLLIITSLLATKAISDHTDSIVAVISILLYFLFIFILHIGSYAWYVKVYIRRYYYSGEEHFITIKKGVFAPAEIHVQWQKIQDVYVDQDILDRMMGLYDVHIASATVASGIEAHIDGVDQAAAEGLKKFLLDKVSGAGIRTNFQNTTTPQSPDQIQQSPQQPPTINLTEEISSNIYPLSDKWVAVTLVSRIIGSFGFGLIFIFFFAKTNLLDYLVYAVLGWLAISVLTVIVRTITLFLWKKNYAFNFTPENIYYREGVISMSEKNMPYSSIQDVAIQQGVIERLFGLARVRIENAATATIQTRRGGTVPIFTGVMLQGLSLADANKITDLLKTTVLGKNTARYGL